MKMIFCDLGKKGAFSIFQEQKLIKIISFELTNKSSKTIQNKLLAFNEVLNEYFDDLKEIKCVATFIPYGLNRKTIINLAMMTTVWMLHFKDIPCYLLHEWTVWRNVLKQKTIPKRQLKKQLTISWAEKIFNLEKINDDEADAILGGFYLSKYYEKN